MIGVAVSGIVNTAVVVAAANAIIVQYNAAFLEVTYVFAVVGVCCCGLVNWRRFSFSSSVRSLVVCSAGTLWRCCIIWISCFAVSGFCFFTVSTMRSLIWSFVAWLRFFVTLISRPCLLF